MTIYKYRLELESVQKIEMPEGAEILTVGMQNRGLFIWVRVIPTNPIKYRIICVRGTGENYDDKEYSFTYIGSTIGDYVWHVFEERA